jgi:hypothetical protein
VDPTLPKVLRGLDEATVFARAYRFEMTKDYLALVARVEGLSQNQSGSDKSQVWRAGHAFRASFDRARLLPRVP